MKNKLLYVVMILLFSVYIGFLVIILSRTELVNNIPKKIVTTYKVNDF